MAMVGQNQSRVHRERNPRSKRWMYQPEPKKKFNFSALKFYFEMCAVTFAATLTLLIVWWNFC
jgi:hypothetical protein